METRKIEKILTWGKRLKIDLCSKVKNTILATLPVRIDLPCVDLEVTNITVELTTDMAALEQFLCTYIRSETRVALRTIGDDGRLHVKDAQATSLDDAIIGLHGRDSASPNNGYW